MAQFQNASFGQPPQKENEKKKEEKPSKTIKCCFIIIKYNWTLSVKSTGEKHSSKLLYIMAEHWYELFELVLGGRE